MKKVEPSSRSKAIEDIIGIGCFVEALVLNHYVLVRKIFQVFECDKLNSFESDESMPTSPVHYRYKSGEGYHDVPPHCTGTFMPPNPDLVFNDAPKASEIVTNVVNVESSSHKPKTLRPDAPIIEDWTSNSEDESELECVPKQKDPSFVQTSEPVKTPRASVKTVEHPTQAENLRTDNQKSKANGLKACLEQCNEVNHHNSARMSHSHSNRNVVSTAVLTKSGLVSLNNARLVSNAVPHTTMKRSPRPVKHVVHKAHLPIKRPINHKPATKANQAPRAWYETLANYILENGFQKGKIDQTLFIKKQKGDILLVQVCVDDIIFGSTNKELCKAFEKLMNDKFQMSLMGELTFFLGLQVKQTDNRIYISQDKYVAEILRKFSFTDVKSASTPIETEKPLLKDPDAEDVECKKQTVVATSSTQAEYVAAASCCAQVLWIQNQLLDYGKKVVITEDVIRYDLHLDDANGVECLPNEEILQSRKFNFSKYIFDNMARNVDSPSKFLMYPRYLQVMINNQVDDLSSHTTKYTSPALTQKVFANMRRIGKEFSGVETPLFASMLVQPQAEEDDVEGRKDDDNAPAKEVNVAEPTVFDDEKVTMTMAQTLIKMKAKKARLLDEQMAKRLHYEEVEQATVREKQEKDDLEKAQHLDNIMKYQSLKRKPVSIAQARKNMIVYLKNMAGYKMEHFKGMTYDKESFKKLKAVEVSASESTQDTPTIDPKEMSEEDVKNMLEIVPAFEFKVEALQVKEDLDALCRLVREKFSTAVPTVNKEKALWVELKRLFKPDIKDMLWKLQIYMHYPLLWKLHSNCGVHQVSSITRRHDMFMLTEKDNPLLNRVMTLMLSTKLQVEEYSEMARDLVLKIFMKANQPKSRSLDTSSKFCIDSGSLNKVYVLVILDLSKVANPLHSLRVKDLFKSKDLHFLKRCKDAHLFLNWEKCHFMIKEGTVLGHKVSKARLEVDKAKIKVIFKLPPPTNIKGSLEDIPKLKELKIKCLCYQNEEQRKEEGLKAKFHIKYAALSSEIESELLICEVGTDMAKITKKWPKPDKNEHEIVKSTQKPDPKTFLCTKEKPKAQQKSIQNGGANSANDQSLKEIRKFLCKWKIITPGTNLAINES
uniref:Putative ribonuclease H-like domain-containing protein n=1 Tax=Tanacetum cinerariifolium TaxID=118510 RepID=A0A6L2KRD8_TANCI|nr:putative ribonuclease H-like domain-containing protein [Tanacetum cinerariifolium]